MKLRVSRRRRPRPHLILKKMKREELARILARLGGVSGSAARDQVDKEVHRILTALRKGRDVDLPGLGKLVTKKPVTKTR
jgi:nucleoid DNA-binding protein